MLRIPHFAGSHIMNNCLGIRMKTFVIALILAAITLSGVHAVEVPGAGTLADLIMRFDTNGDGKIDTGEWQTGVEASFDEIDTNRDGKITEAEIDALSGPLEGEVGSIVATLVPKLIKPLS